VTTIAASPAAVTANEARITGSRPNLSASRLPVIVPAAPAISIVVSAASPSCLPPCRPVPT
jgi:hypothetical protein